MMLELKETTLEKLEKSDFDSAAKLVEVALTMDAENSDFNILREFLTQP